MGMDVKVTMPATGDHAIDLDINGASLGTLAEFTRFYRNTNDIKYNHLDAKLNTWGFYKTCSVAGGTLHTFLDDQVNLDKLIVERNKNPCALLLAADCTPKTSFAVFLQPIAGAELSDRFAIRYFVGQISIKYSPDDPEHVIVNNPLVTDGDSRIPIRNLTLSSNSILLKHLW